MNTAPPFALGPLTALSFALGIGLLAPASGEAQIVDQPRADAALGKEIRITTLDGTRITGRLVELSDLDVVFQQSGSHRRLTLATVRRIDRVRHTVRNATLWSGVAVGVTTASFSRYLEDDGTADTIGFVLAHTGLAAAIGAGVGAIVNTARRKGSVIYQAPGTATLGEVSPWLSTRGAGVRWTMEW